MDHTLFQILKRLFEAEQEIDSLRAQIRELQAAYTDLKEAKDALESIVP